MGQDSNRAGRGALQVGLLSTKYKTGVENGAGEKETVDRALTGRGGLHSLFR